MNEPFLLEITYQNQTLKFQAAFQRYGFSYRVAVLVNDVTYIFEPDEEGEYHVVTTEKEKSLPDMVLLAAVAAKLKKL